MIEKENKRKMNQIKKKIQEMKQNSNFLLQTSNLNAYSPKTNLAKRKHKRGKSNPYF